MPSGSTAGISKEDLRVRCGIPGAVFQGVLEALVRQQARSERQGVGGAFGGGCTVTVTEFGVAPPAV